MLTLKPDSIQKSSGSFSTILAFTKMQALGNDFVIVSESDLRQTIQALDLVWSQSVLSTLAKKLCDRHFGIGADGLIIASRSEDPSCEISWLYLNSDGSSSLMCGNGLRCLALWSKENAWVKGHKFQVLTGKGPVAVDFESAEKITIDIGQPFLEPADIPVTGAGTDSVVKREFTFLGRKFIASCVGMGNPHCVIFDPATKEEELSSLAVDIQRSAYFPESVNVEFAWCRDRYSAEVIVFERGCGATLACASGAAAVLVAGVLEGRLDRRADIKLPGGNLIVAWNESGGNVTICGSARTSFAGQIDLAGLELSLS